MYYPYIGAKCENGEKEKVYRSYLEKLPQINFVTLRKLIGHLHFLDGLSDKNKMPVENLAAIWAPTLMHVEVSFISTDYITQ